MDTGFGHALSEQVLDICLEKGGQCPKYKSNIRGYMQVYCSLGVYRDGKLIVRTEKGAVRDVK